jgi:hypothetical protein
MKSLLCLGECIATIMTINTMKKAENTYDAPMKPTKTVDIGCDCESARLSSSPLRALKAWIGDSRHRSKLVFCKLSITDPKLVTSIKM